MIQVQCPSCAAPYDLDERRLPASGVRMRCPKCGESFHVGKDGSVGAPGAAPGAASVRSAHPTAVGVGTEGAKPPPPSRPPPARKPTMAGVGEAKPAFVPPPPSRVAPPSAADDLELDLLGGLDLPGSDDPDDLDSLDLDADLPALKEAARKAPPRALDTLDVDLPAPKGAAPAPAAPAAPRRPLAPDFEADLPALKGAAPAPANPAAPRRPLAPDFEADLPAPKGAAPAPAAPTAPRRPLAPDFGADLPAPKGAAPAPAAPAAPRRPLAPDFGADLPAPKGAAAAPAEPAATRRPLAPDFADLPAPKGASRALPDLDADLPMPKGATPGRPRAPEVDLPAPKRAQGSTPFDDMMGGDELDLPAPKAALDELDLPAPKSASGFGDLDLPAPKSAAGGFGEIDLPTPKSAAPKSAAGGFGEIDLPTPKSAGGFGEIDLPTPKSAGGFGEIDLPTPKSAGFDGLDLPMPKNELDLPAPKDGLDLPTPQTAGFELDLDLPGPKGNIDLPAPGAGSAGSTDLPIGKGLSLDLPTSKSAPPPGADDLAFDDDLALPPPRARGASPDGRSGAGSAAFGELDLGGEANDGLEFAGIPEEAPSDLPGGMDLPSDAVARPDAKKKKAKPTADATPKKRGKGLLVFMGVVLALAGVGVGLKWTSLGIFGTYYFEQFRSEAGDEATITRTLADVEARAALDTYADVRAALQQLGVARRELFLNRHLLARSAMHEALYQHRFGQDARSAAREVAIAQRLEERGNDAPGIALMFAARALKSGRLGEIPGHLATARSEAPGDPYVSLIAGEHALASGQVEGALEAFRAASETGARAGWGVVRALLAAPERDEAAIDAALDAVLQQSPNHTAALVLRAERAFAAGDDESAIGAANLATGEPEGAARGSGPERAAAWAMLGRVHEARGRRGAARGAYESAIAADAYHVGALLGAGRVLTDERRFRDALVRFEAAEQAAPSDAHDELAEALIGQIRANLQIDQAPRALEKAQQLVQRRPDDAEAALWHGRALDATDDDDAAKAELERAIELAPQTFDAYLALAQLHFANDDPGAAAATLRRSRDHVEVTAQVRRLLGESELRRGNLAEAERELRGALSLDARDAGALFLLGSTLRRLGRLAEAEQVFGRLADLDAGYPGLSLERGRIFEAMGRADRAAQAYARALEQAPDDLDLVQRLGAAQLAAGMLDEAEPTLRRVLTERPDTAEPEHFVGRLELAKGEVQRALRHLGRAVDLDPQVAEYRMYLAWANLDANALGRAAEEIASAIALDPQMPEAYLVRGLIGNRTGAVRDARADFERALGLRSTLHAARAGLGDALDQLGDRSGAVRAYEAAVAGDPTRGDWWYRLGRVRLDAGRRGEAAQAFARAIDAAGTRTPTWLPEAHRLKAEAHRLGGERAAAVTHYRRYLELAPAGAIDRQDVQDRLLDLGAR
ncbi:MAG: zinc-ribbon domain-containing protein [Myxococcales bacterium]|nr:zinc-ribbon domain-containing protein [Myxococcales bacterium]